MLDLYYVLAIYSDGLLFSDRSMAQHINLGPYPHNSPSKLWFLLTIWGEKASFDLFLKDKFKWLLTYMCENVVLHAPLMLLTFRSPRGVTNYSMRHYVLHIQRWFANSTPDISPSILSRSIPTHLFPLYKALRGTIFHFSLENLQDL